MIELGVPEVDNADEKRLDLTNESQVNEFLSELYPQVHRRVRERLGETLRSHEESMDIVQRTIATFWQFLPQFDFRSKNQLSTLLHQMVENTICSRAGYWRRACRDIAREQGMGEESSIVWGDPPAQGASPSAVVAHNEDKNRLYVATRVLSPEDQQIIFLHDSGLTHTQLGDIIKKSPDAARMRYKRALVRLAKVMTTLQSGDVDKAIADAQSGIESDS